MESPAAYLRLSAEDSFALNFAGHKVWYDEASQCLILLRKSEYRAISMLNNSQDRKRGEVFLRCKFDGSALDVKLSPCCRFVAIQSSEHEIQLIGSSNSVDSPQQQSTITCQGKGNIVLRGGVIWMRATAGQAKLLLVTRDGLQLFQSNESGGAQFTYQTSISLFRVKYFWSLPSLQLLLVQTEEGEMRPFDLSKSRGSAVDKWAKFMTTEDGGPSPEQGEAALVALYGEPWFIHIRKQEMIVYRLAASSTKRFKTIQSFHGPTYGISAIDSLLIAHSQQAKVSLLFDVLQQDDVEPGECFVAPLSIACGDDDVTESETPIAAYASSWVFLPPYWVLDARLGRVWRLEVCLKNIVKLYPTVSPPTDRLAKFLVRRMDDDSDSAMDAEARNCLFEHLLQPELRLLNVALPWLRVLADHCEPSNVATVSKNAVIIYQREVCERLFDRLDASEDAWVASLAIEYARYLSLNVYTTFAPPSEVVFLTVAKTLLASKRWEELYQLCLFQILPAQSQAIVHQVLQDAEFCASNVARQQVAMDALFRLQKHKPTLWALLSRDSFTQALRFCVKHHDALLGDLSTITELFKACHRQIDRLAMLHNLLLAYKAEWIQPGRLKEEGLSKYVLPEMSDAFGCE